MSILVRCLPVLLLACALAAADQAPQPGSSTITALEVTLKRTVSFPEGKIAEAAMEQSLEVRLGGKVDPALMYSGQSKTVCDSATTDTGEDVLQPQVDPRAGLPARYRRPMRMGMDKDRLWPDSIRLKYPGKPAKSLSVSGAVILTCEAKKGETVELALGGGEQLIQGLKITAVKGQKPGEATINYDNALESLIKTAEFVDAAGKVLETRGYNGSGDNKGMTKTFNLKLADAVAVTARITLIGEEVEVRVPFAFKDLPFEAPPAKEQPRIRPVLRTPGESPVPPPPAKNDF
jgi:hypothetical protein